MNILELSNKQRLTLLAVISVVSIATIYLVIQVVHKQYQPVFEDNNLANVAQVTTLLEEKGIPFELSNAGTRIEIPEALINQAKVDLAQNNYGLPSNSGYELFDEIDYSMTKQAQKITFLRAIQGELERTLESYQEIKKARVHISKPERKLFDTDKKPATASVSLWFEDKKNFSQHQVASVKQLIASSVDDLSAKHVVVLDGSGKQISKRADNLSQLYLLEQKAALENYYKRKAQEILALYFNVSQYAVSVSISLNDKHFKQVSNEIVVPDQFVDGAITRKKETKTTSNQPNEKAQDKNTAIEVEYQHGQLRQESVVKPGGIENISAAVAISAEISDSSLEKLRSLVYAGLGLSDRRDDRLSLEVIPVKVPVRLAAARQNDATSLPNVPIAAVDIKQKEFHSEVTHSEVANSMWAWVLASCAAVLLAIGAFVSWRQQPKKVNQEQLLLELEQWLEKDRAVS